MNAFIAEYVSGNLKECPTVEELVPWCREDHIVADLQDLDRVHGSLDNEAEAYSKREVLLARLEMLQTRLWGLLVGAARDVLVDGDEHHAAVQEQAHHETPQCEYRRE
jgi:hypothetical protein